MERLLKTVNVMLLELETESILEYGRKREEVLELLSDFRITGEGKNLVCIRETALSNFKI